MPDCPHFPACGGCTCLTTPIAEQRRARLAHALEVLGPHAAGIELAFTDTAEAAPLHYRMRLLYPVQPDRRRGLRLGLYRRGTHEIIEPDACVVQHPALTRLGTLAKALLRDHAIPPYDETTHTGCLRAFCARLAATTGELQIGLVTATADLPEEAALRDGLRAAAAGLQDVALAGIVHNTNPDRGNALLGRTNRVLWGGEAIHERFAELTLRISFGSFYQLHRDAPALLFQQALDLLGPLAGARVVDGYGGVGTFALPLARAGATVDLVEMNPAACADARHNAAANDLAVTVHEAAFGAASLLPRPDVLLVDPNRAGLLAAGRAQLQRLAAPRVLYVACGLPALRRDLDALRGYRLAQARLVDLFPHTGHVEVLALLRREGGIG